MANEYATLAMLKLALAGTQAGSTTVVAMDSSYDDLLNAALSAASRGIDAITGRRFYADTSATARIYSPKGLVIRDPEGERLLVDDISSTTGLVVETGTAGGSTWTAVASTSYETGPDNALARGVPITSLLHIYGCWRSGSASRIRVTAKWGWPAIPDVVVQATLLQAARLFKRRQSPEGVIGNAEWGVMRVSRVDPDVEALVSHLVIPGFA